MTVMTSSARHLLVRFAQPARLPGAVLAALRDEVVLAGWMRASGVLSEVQLKVGESAAPRLVEGTFHVIALEGSIGLARGDVSCGMRAVLTRDTGSGFETIAGEIVEARIDALEVLVTAFDDVTATRQLDAADAWVLDAAVGVGRTAPAPAGAAARSEVSSLPAAQTAPAPADDPPAPELVMPSPLQSGFSEVVRAARDAEVERPAPTALAPPPPRAASPATASPKPSPTFSSPMNQAMPQRIARPAQDESEDDPVPEPGDVVDHFAFGRCEVVKTDGDRLHVRLGKDQRIKEIALEMLKVTALPAEDGQSSRHWKLARKL